MPLITEGSAKIKVAKTATVSKAMPVFYNPVMKFNRDCSVWLLKALNLKKMRIALPLCGTGIRGIRFLLELPKGMIGEIYFNDMSQRALTSVKKHLTLNKIKLTKKIHLSCTEANLFLRENKGFDYIDIDPFGSPNPFLDSAIVRLKRGGILAVTATDTAALCGTAEKSCWRKYWAQPSRNEIMHEVGLRILIRKVQLMGMQYEKALIPLLSYSRDHYMRIFFVCEKGKEKVAQIWKCHQQFHGAGPLWIGPLHDSLLVAKMVELSKDPFLEIINEESTLPVVGYYDIHELCSQNHIHLVPPLSTLLERIRKTHPAVRTHFCGWGVKTTMNEDELVGLLRSL